MINRTTITVGELVRRGQILVSDGYRTSRSELAPAGFRIIRAADVEAGSVDLSGTDFVDFGFEKAIGKKSGVGGDILLTTKGTVGRVGVLPQVGNLVVYSPQLCFFRTIHEDIVTGRYLRYWLEAPAFKSQAADRMNNTDMAAYINLSDIYSLELDLPPLCVQRSITEILGALDDKIAANRGVAEVGEELLGAHFDRLGLDGEDPDSLVPITSLIELNPLIPRPVEAEPVYVDMQALPTNGMCISSWSSRPPKGGARFQNGDTLLARITPCLENRKTGFVDFLAEGQVGLGSTEYVVMRTRKGVPPVLSYFLAVSERFRTFAIRHMVGTSGRQRVGADVLREYEIRLPGREELERFGALSVQIASMLASVRTENQLLAETRDVLLPQLMSGRLRVKDAEKQVEAMV